MDANTSPNVLFFPAQSSATQGVSDVKRLEVLDLFELAEQLSTTNAALALEKGKTIDLYFALSRARLLLMKFQENQAAFSLTRESAATAIVSLNVVLIQHFYADGKMDKFKDDLNFEQEMATWQFYAIKSALSEFRHVFSAECRKSETYFIEQKMGFDISLLLHKAHQNIHPSVMPFISKAAVEEIKSSGRCFALENYTACGFHILRALEVVMADYYKQVSGKDKEFRSWHDYIQAFTRLEKSRTKRASKYPSPKVAAMLDRMRQLDRNPLMHPRDSLDEMAADTLFKLGIVTITELAKDLREMAAEPELRLITDNAAETA